MSMRHALSAAARRTVAPIRRRRFCRPSAARLSLSSSSPSSLPPSLSSPSDAVHPTVDVSPLLSDDPRHPGRADAVARIGAALRKRGYFYAQNVDVLSPEYIQSIYDFSRRIHGLPADVKRRFAQRDGHGAYSGLDIGQAELAYDPDTVASVRAWDYSRTRFTLKKADDPTENRYPGRDLVDPPYVEFMDDLYDRQDRLGQALMVAFAECLGLPRYTFRDMFVGGGGGGGEDSEGSHNGDFGTIRLLSYPETSVHAAERANVGISAHTDFEAFTLMHQGAPGLQFIPASGEGWVDAPVRAGEFVVIVGDVLERFTNGELRATPHRVVTTPHPRQSIIRFNAVTADTVVAPLPQFVDADRPAKYSPVTMRTHMETTMRNLQKGIGAWDEATQTSLTATYDYSQTSR